MRRRPARVCRCAFGCSRDVPHHARVVLFALMLSCTLLHTLSPMRTRCQEVPSSLAGAQGFLLSSTRTIGWSLLHATQHHNVHRTTHPQATPVCILTRWALACTSSRGAIHTQSKYVMTVVRGGKQLSSGAEYCPTDTITVQTRARMLSLHVLISKRLCLKHAPHKNHNRCRMHATLVLLWQCRFYFFLSAHPKRVDVVHVVINMPTHMRTHVLH